MFPQIAGGFRKWSLANRPPQRRSEWGRAIKKTTVYLTDEIESGLEAISRRKHRPKADLIREALAEYIAEEQPALPRWIGMIKDDDGSLRSDNVDEWLEENWHPE
jgi:predicted transcriptional regulator